MRKLNNFEPILNQILKNFQPKAAVSPISSYITNLLFPVSLRAGPCGELNSYKSCVFR